MQVGRRKKIAWLKWRSSPEQCSVPTFVINQSVGHDYVPLPGPWSPKIQNNSTFASNTLYNFSINVLSFVD